MTTTNKDKAPIIRLVRYRNWLIPKNASDYRKLHRLKFPSTKIHEDTIPSIALLAKKKGVRIKAVRFAESILKPYFQQLSDVWGVEQGFSSSYTSKEFQFWTTSPKCAERALEHFPDLEESIRAFLVRWGFESEFQYSEARGRHKLVVSYWFSKLRKPEILIKDTIPLEEQSPQVLELGNHRITLSSEGGWLLWKLETRTGDSWAHIVGARCKHRDVSDPSAFFTSIVGAFNDGKL